MLTAVQEKNLLCVVYYHFGTLSFPIEWWGAGVVICLVQGADLHTAQLMLLPLTVSCFSKIKIGFYLSGTGSSG